MIKNEYLGEIADTLELLAQYIDARSAATSSASSLPRSLDHFAVGLETKRAPRWAPSFFTHVSKDHSSSSSSSTSAPHSRASCFKLSLSDSSAARNVARNCVLMCCSMHSRTIRRNS